MDHSMFRPASRAVGAKAFALTLLLATACGLSWAHAQDPKVTIDNFTFTPAESAVTPGTTVTWSNADDIPHTVVSDDKIFKSKPLDTDDKFSFTFTKPGEYGYFCSLHPHMTGKIVVKMP